MKMVRITRVSSHPDHGTFGAVVVNGRPVCVSLEPYKRDNASNVSCIPEGQYICQKYNSPTYGETYKVTEVQGRSAILFHCGNDDEDTEGCILLGSSFDVWSQDVVVSSSRAAFTKFINAIGGEDKFYLTVVESF